MKGLINFIKKNSWIWIIVAVIAAYIGDIYLQKLISPQASPTPTPVAQIALFKSVTPGVSTEADLNKVLGTPIKTTVNGSQVTDEYKVNNTVRNTIAIIQNGKVYLIKEVISATDTTMASSITSVYGAAPNILYQNSPNSAFNLYVYPANGIAYLGHQDGTLQEIWYFAPTTFEGFKTTWAPDYLTSPPAQVFQ